jgi:hypothetical protein
MMSQNTAIFATLDRYEYFILGIPNYSLCMLFCEKSRSLIHLCTYHINLERNINLQAYCNVKKLQLKIFGPEYLLIDK